MRRCAGEIARLQPGDVGLPRLDGDRGAVGGRARQVGGGHLQQIGVPVVHDPVLRPGQQRREPAAHRPGAAAEVVDHLAGRLPGGVRPRCSTRSGARAAASAGSRRASHPQLTRISSTVIAHAPARTPARTDVVVDHPGERLAPLAGGPAQPPSAARRRRARPAAPRRAPRGRRAGPAAPAASRRRRDRGPPSAHRRRLRRPAAHGPEPRSRPCRTSPRATRAPAGPRRRSCGRDRLPSAVPGSAPGRPARGPARGGGDPRRTPGSRSRLPTHTQCQGRSVVAASASSSTSCPLPEVTAATHSSAPPPPVPGASSAASTAGSATCTRSAGNRYSSSSRLRAHALVVTTRGGTREDRALPRPGLLGPVIGRAIAQRHVHEHDQPQPARLRHQRLGGRRGDQSVEQHDGVVGDPPDDVGEGGARRRVGSRPAARHGVLVHRPADRGEPPADAAVIGVAAARPGRVVDALG